MVDIGSVVEIKSGKHSGRIGVVVGYTLESAQKFLLFGEPLQFVVDGVEGVYTEAELMEVKINPFFGGPELLEWRQA